MKEARLNYFNNFQFFFVVVVVVRSKRQANVTNKQNNRTKVLSLKSRTENAIEIKKKEKKK